MDRGGTLQRVMQFDDDFETGGVIGKNMGRIKLSGGYIFFHLLPDGLHIKADQKLLQDGSIIIAPETIQYVKVEEDK
jgi:hypothetical protein